MLPTDIKLMSADDHMIEPPHLWVDRVPARALPTSAAALAAEQAEVLARAQARLDELIGLDRPKEQIALWRTEIQIDQLLAAQGEETSSTNENHMVLEGSPGTA